MESIHPGKCTTLLLSGANKLGMYNKYFPMKYPVSTLISNISTTRYSIKATQAGTIYLVVVNACKYKHKVKHYT